MKEIKNKESFSCGYGLIGLCCSACLLGPCRISPFDEEEAKGFCGDDRDFIVAKNLLRQVISVVLEELNHIEDIPKDSKTYLEIRGRNSRYSELKKGIAKKYGLLPNISKRSLIYFLHKGLDQLLSPIRGENVTLFSNLYPEMIFPYLYKDNISSGSLTSLIIDSMKRDDRDSLKIEKILGQSIKISLYLLVLEELIGDIKRLLIKDETKGDQIYSFKNLEYISSFPSPILILLIDEDSPFKGEIDEVLKKIDKTISIISLNNISSLPVISRELFRRWQTPISEMNAMVLISSNSVTSILGALALGFKTTSIPMLPIHGSKKVEDFFFIHLKNRFGSIYLSFKKGDLSSTILNLFKRDL